jgi:hypothetical protein
MATMSTSRAMAAAMTVALRIVDVDAGGGV